MAGRIKSTKNLKDPIGDQTRFLPTALLRVPLGLLTFHVLDSVLPNAENGCLRVSFKVTFKLLCKM